MLTSLTGTIEFWMACCTVLITIGAYWLLTKQNSEKLKELVEKFDNVRMEIKVEQVKMQSNFQHMGDTMNRIEKDTTITREKTNDLSQAVGKIEVRLQRLENGGHRNEFV